MGLFLVELGTHIYDIASRSVIELSTQRCQEGSVLDRGLTEFRSVHGLCGVCVQGLGDTFKRIRDDPAGFAPWTYLGTTDTGVFV